VPCPHYTKELCKHSFISTARPTPIHHKNRAFRFGSSNKKNLIIAGFVFKCGQRTCWKQSFTKTMTSQIMWFPCQATMAWVSLKHKSKITDYCIFKFLRRSVDGALHTCSIQIKQFCAQYNNYAQNKGLYTLVQSVNNWIQRNFSDYQIELSLWPSPILSVFQIVFIQLFPNWTAHLITYTNTSRCIATPLAWTMCSVKFTTLIAQPHYPTDFLAKIKGRSVARLRDVDMIWACR